MTTELSLKSEEVVLLAKTIAAKNVSQPLILALEGELGSGKTTFTQYLAKELGINDVVISPTFILQREYNLKNRGKLYHLDLYRIESLEEFNELNIKSLLKENNIIVIEWADKFEKEIKNLHKKARIIWLIFKHDTATTRLVTLHSHAA